MEVKATAKYVKVQPRKVRIIADEVRGMPAVRTAALLQYHPSKSARFLRKVLMSAVANAQENHQIPANSLRIATIMVDQGPVLKRMRARAMGRGFRIMKKTSHITVVVEEFEAEPKVKAKPKAKARPTFGAAGKKSKKAGASSAAQKPAAESQDLALETQDLKSGAEEPIEEVMQPESVANEPQEATPVDASNASEEGSTPETQDPTPETGSQGGQ